MEGLGREPDVRLREETGRGILTTLEDPRVQTSGGGGTEREHRPGGPQ